MKTKSMRGYLETRLSQEEIDQIEKQATQEMTKNTIKMSIYITPEVRAILDRYYAECLKNGKRKSYGQIITEAIYTYQEHRKENV